MTPREIAGVLHFAEIDARHEQAEKLAGGAMAAQGESKAIKRRLKELTKE